MPPRRSTRSAVAQKKEDIKSEPKAAKTKAAPAKKRGRLASPSADDVDRKGEPSRKKSQARVKTGTLVGSTSDQARTRGKGKLGLFADAPLDVLLEIFSHLDPLDLLRISRTTKMLRSLLMEKSSIAVWQGALKGIKDLPPIIEGLNEPQYANLMFDDHCHNCSQGPTNYILWQLRMRLCKECLDNGSIMATEEQLRQRHRFRDIDKAFELLTIIPRFRYVPQVLRIWCYHRRSWERVLKESAPLQRDTPEYAAWLSKKRKEHDDQVESCKVYQNWLNSWTAAKAEEQASLRQQRLASTIARLKADGWEEELKPQSTLDILNAHPLVNLPKELNDRHWDSIRPNLLELMSNLRAKLLNERIQCAIQERIQTLEEFAEPVLARYPETPHNPPASALCIYQPFLDIIKNTPPEEDATDKLKNALEAIPKICKEWRQEQSARLKAMLHKKKGRGDDLSLVVNAFTCLDCSKDSPPTVLHYPHFATHACFFSTASVGETNVRVWSDKAVKALDQDIYKRCVAFVRECGLDPNTATADDMDAVDVFFRCEQCEAGQKPKEGKKSVRLMRWRTAMNHQHVDGVTRVDDAKLIALGRSEETSMFEQELSWLPAYRGYHWTFVCVHCNVAEADPAARVEHLRLEHGIDSPPRMTDHYRRSLKYTNLSNLLVVVEVDSEDT